VTTGGDGSGPPPGRVQPLGEEEDEALHHLQSTNRGPEGFESLPITLAIPPTAYFIPIPHQLRKSHPLLAGAAPGLAGSAPQLRSRLGDPLGSREVSGSFGPTAPGLGGRSGSMRHGWGTAGRIASAPASEPARGLVSGAAL